MPALLADHHRPPRQSSPSSASSSSLKPPAPSLDSSLHVQAALNELLSNPLKFEKSKLQPPKVKYPPINADLNGAESSKGAASKMTMDYDEAPRNAVASSSKLDPAASPSSSSSSSPSLYSGRIPLTWPREAKPVGAGLHNRGNTCYMNSTMQALVHTAPLAHLLLTQDAQLLKGKYGGTVKSFDAVRGLQTFVQRAIGKNGGKQVTVPEEFIRNLKSVAKTFHHGRQEDAHEWLRLLLDSLQQACLAGASAKAKQSPLLREATFIHKIFGGKLRSRVTCLKCKHHSDTFDPILDLSLDIRRCNSLKDAFHLFTEVEELRGSEKYRCEKCKGLVNAEKHFKIEQAPNVLTVHLKRFTFTGAKITRPIAFPDKLRLKSQWMSSGQEGPLYSLFAVVHHYGGGPHSGHYVAEVKSPAGRWYNMNDDMVSQCSKPGDASKSAYMLFYVREGGNADTLSQAISTATSASASVNGNGSANGKAAKRPLPPAFDEDEEDLGSRPATAKHPPPSTTPAGSPSAPAPAALAASNSNSSPTFKHPSKAKAMMKKDRSLSSPLANSVRSPYAASYGGTSTNGAGSPPSSRFSMANAPGKHGSDFLSRIGGGGGGKKKKKLNGGGGSILSPVDPGRFHAGNGHGSPPPSHGGGAKMTVREKMKGRKSV